MKRISAALLLLLGLASAALAQAVTNPAPVGDAGAYNTSVPTCTASQFCFLQVDVNGNLKVVGVAAETHIGEVGSNGTTITSALVTSNNTVTTGKAIGPLQTLANAVRVSGAVGAAGTSGYIQTVILSFTDAVGAGPLDVYYFNANPTGSTCTDNTTFALAAADRGKVIGIVHVTDFTASNTAAIAQANNQSMLFSAASATSIFACVVSRGSFAITGTSNATLDTKIARN
jgi:hypothetical protein